MGLPRVQPHRTTQGTYQIPAMRRPGRSPPSIGSMRKNLPKRKTQRAIIVTNQRLTGESWHRRLYPLNAVAQAYGPIPRATFNGSGRPQSDTMIAIIMIMMMKKTRLRWLAHFSSHPRLLDASPWVVPRTVEVITLHHQEETPYLSNLLAPTALGTQSERELDAIPCTT